MKERGILFSAPMVRAILDGTKTQTRRVVKPQPTDWIKAPGCFQWATPRHTILSAPWEGINVLATDCPHGKPGDCLWVRETWNTWGTYDHLAPSEITPNSLGIAYAADMENPHEEACGKKRPSIFMPRWASRITLEITAVRVERLQDISAADVIAEGAWPRDYTCVNNNWQRKWIELWDGINGKTHPWESNPFVWVLEFTRIGQ